MGHIRQGSLEFKPLEGSYCKIKLLFLGWDGVGGGRPQPLPMNQPRPEATGPLDTADWARGGHLTQGSQSQDGNSFCCDLGPILPWVTPSPLFIPLVLPGSARLSFRSDGTSLLKPPLITLFKVPSASGQIFFFSSILFSAVSTAPGVMSMHHRLPPNIC